MHRLVAINQPKKNVSTVEKSDFYLAVKQGNLELVRQLIESTDINAQTKRGFTALHAAAAGGHDRVVTLLINSGARLDCETLKHCTCLDYILTGKLTFDTIIDILMDNKLVSIELRQKTLRNKQAMKNIRKNHTDEEAMTFTLLLMKGSYKFAANRTDWQTYLYSDKKTSLKFTETLNCNQTLLYAADLLGLVNKEKIRGIFSSLTHIIKDNPDNSFAQHELVNSGIMRSFGLTREHLLGEMEINKLNISKTEIVFFELIEEGSPIMITHMSLKINLGPKKTWLIHHPEPEKYTGIEGVKLDEAESYIKRFYGTEYTAAYIEPLTTYIKAIGNLK